MSRKNVEVVRAVVEAWEAGDIDVVRDSYDPHIIVRYAEDWPEGSEPTVGRDAVIREFVQLRESFYNVTIEELSDFIDAGDRVVVRQVWHGVGRVPDLAWEFTSIATLRRGKFILIEFFWDHAEALELVGLSELAAPTDS